MPTKPSDSYARGKAASKGKRGRKLAPSFADQDAFQKALLERCERQLTKLLGRPLREGDRRLFTETVREDAETPKDVRERQAVEILDQIAALMRQAIALTEGAERLSNATFAIYSQFRGVFFPLYLAELERLKPLLDVFRRKGGERREKASRAALVEEVLTAMHDGRLPPCTDRDIAAMGIVGGLRKNVSLPAKVGEVLKLEADAIGAERRRRRRKKRDSSRIKESHEIELNATFRPIVCRP